MGESLVSQKKKSEREEFVDKGIFILKCWQFESMYLKDELEKDTGVESYVRRKTMTDILTSILYENVLYLGKYNNQAHAYLDEKKYQQILGFAKARLNTYALNENTEYHYLCEGKGAVKNWDEETTIDVLKQITQDKEKELAYQAKQFLAQRTNDLGNKEDKMNRILFRMQEHNFIPGQAEQ